MTMRRITVEDPSQVGDIRRQASALAGTLGFGSVASGRAAIVASELATNILRHGGGGEILLDAIERDDARVQLIALDKGKGIPDVDTAMGDGYSTSGSAGSGLGAIRRQATAFDIYSRLGQGTAVLAEIAKATPRRSVTEPYPDVGGVAVPLRGEAVSGDAWCLRRDGKGLTVILVDGLGHGPAAHDAAHLALNAFIDAAHETLEGIVDAVHRAGRGGRGTAIGVLRLDPDVGGADFAGIGNIESCLANQDGRKRMVSEPGIVGTNMKRVRVMTYEYAEYVAAILHSDGVSGNWTLDPYPGLLDHHPSLVAAVIYRDFRRERDDASVVVARWMAS